MSRSYLVLFISTFAFLASITAGAILTSNMLTLTRGVTYLPSGVAREPMLFGVNVDLDQYDDSDLSRALSMIHDGKFTLVRQHFYWKDIEPRQGEFDWDKWDRIVASAKEHQLDLVAVIDTTPVWARDPGEADLPNASPARPDDYARFVAAIVRRYASIRYIQIWDNPNVHSFWGRRNADPFEYTALLRTSAIAARAASPNVKLISAGLAPNGELVREHPDYSDVLFLREMYEYGARDYMDVVADKPYGMWSGPDDRRADKDVFNFSRAIVLHDEMAANGDANKPMWAVEFGWNAQPLGSEGAPSPWGTDSDQVQSARLAAAVQRAQSEWTFMRAMIAQTFQPNAPSGDPVWGFSLVDKAFRPSGLYSALTDAITQPVSSVSFNFALFLVQLTALALIAAVSAWRSVLAAREISWHHYWHAIESRFTALPEFAQFVILGLAVVAFYVSSSTLFNFALFAIIVLLFALRLDLGLVVTIFSIPFYLFPKNLIGGAQFSLVELLTLAAVVARIIRLLFDEDLRAKGDKLEAELKSNWFARMRSRLSALDWAVIFFVLAAILSVKFAANFGVANREFRVIVFEPALLYALIRSSGLGIDRLKRLIDALIMSALVVSLIGLYQFLFTNWVIIGEGVRRILAVYGSPNNLALYLDRVLPIVIALAIFDDDQRRRFAYAGAAIPIALCLYLTYSRAALLFGLPAGLIVIGFLSQHHAAQTSTNVDGTPGVTLRHSGRRAMIALGALLVVGIIALIPFTQTERWRSLFQAGTGTGFFRVSVWQSAIEMIRDHPIFGVGLDNFLYEYPKYIRAEAWREPNLSHPHNIVLDFWSRMGIPGVIALVWMVVAFLQPGWRMLTHTLIHEASPQSIGTPNAHTRVGDASRPFFLKGERMQARALAIGLMAGMAAALVHGMIDAAYFFVDLAYVWMLMLGVMGEIERLRD
jgi:O-antigen ligase